jgi:hypothetical protein
MLMPMWRLRPPDSAPEYQALTVASETPERTRSMVRLLFVAKILPLLIGGVVILGVTALWVVR